MVYLIYVIILNLMISKSDAITIAYNGVQDRIFNGTKPRTGELPFMVLILTNVFMPGNRFMSICSGSLIGFNSILSVAHCFQGKSPENVVVMVGLADALRYAIHRYTYPFRVKYNSRTLQEAVAQAIHIHHNFHVGYDLAIVKIAKPFLKTEHVSTIPFALDQYPLGMPCNISGYGLNSSGLFGGLAYFSTTEVQNDLRRCGFPSNHHFFYCLDRSSPFYSTTCQGDSGGPLVYNNKVYGVYKSYRYMNNNSFHCGAPGALRLVSLAASEVNGQFLTVYSRTLVSSSNQLLPQFYVLITVLLFFDFKL